MPSQSVLDVYRQAMLAHRQGRLSEASALYERILSVEPDHAGALHLMGVVALQRHEYDRAVDLITRSLDIEPKHGLALSNLGVALRAQGLLEQSIGALEKAVALEPAMADAWGNLGQSLVRLGRVSDAAQSMRRALELDPQRLAFHMVSLFAENYLADRSPAEMSERARAFGRLVAAKIPARADHANDRDPDRLLRVGMVSADLRSHPVGRFASSFLPHLDRERISITAYSSRKQDDAVARHIRDNVSAWVEVDGLTDDELAARIVEDGIDVLIDMSGHTDGNRLLAFARKPAPVAFTWLGYFATTGFASIDYVLANRWVIPEQEEGQWMERVWRLPDTYLCFAVTHDAPQVAPLPALASGRLTFGSFNNFNKLNDETLRSWSGLLAAVPDSRLILRSSGKSSDETHREVWARLAVSGIDLERVRIDPRIDTYAAHLASYSEIDIALDAYPYTGGTTSVEALFMGVPVLTRKGDRYVAHMGESILNNAALPDWIAADGDDFVRLGARKAADMAGLAQLRAALRERMLSSPLFDAERFARNFEVAVRGMWRHWCAQRNG